ncbi:MAG: putative glycoside hydrolase [Firmicutes bacterium]|nr:putative glycoside hydrolase [Bacillota bacterium]
MKRNQWLLMIILCFSVISLFGLTSVPSLNPESQVNTVYSQTLINEITPIFTPTGTPPASFETPSPTGKRYAVPERVYGVYSTAWTAGISKIDSIINFIKENGLNSLVIDVKDDTGIISYPSNVPLAMQIGAGSKRISDIKGLIARVKKAGIYPIARIVVFKDPLLARSHSEWAVRDKNGGLWKDRKGMIWVDPNNREVWKYNVEIAKEAINLGFSEIQYDYVRFLSDGKISNCIYPFSTGQPKEDVIRDFLLYAKKEINALNTPLSADIFGLVLSVPDDLNIGQKLEKIAAAVDYISPMVYPSHYPSGSFEFKDPDSHPYEVILKAFQIGNKRIQGSQAKFRPWLQDFDLKSHYGKEQLKAQIKGLKDNGIHDWIFWNPSNRYDPAKYQFD